MDHRVLIFLLIIFILSGICIYYATKSDDKKDAPSTGDDMKEKDDIKNEDTTVMPTDRSLFKNNRSIVCLGMSDFDGKNLKKKRTGLILFYANWCGHCKDSVDLWSSVADTASFCDVMAIDCAQHNLPILKEMVSGFPTIYLYKDGKPIKKYEGNREAKELLLTCLEICPNKNCKSN